MAIDIVSFPIENGDFPWLWQRLAKYMIVLSSTWNMAVDLSTWMIIQLYSSHLWLPRDDPQPSMFPATNQLIGLREKSQEDPIFHRKFDGFRLKKFPFLSTH